MHQLSFEPIQWQRKRFVTTCASLRLLLCAPRSVARLQRHVPLARRSNSTRTKEDHQQTQRPSLKFVHKCSMVSFQLQIRIVTYVDFGCIFFILYSFVCVFLFDFWYFDLYCCACSWLLLLLFVSERLWVCVGRKVQKKSLFFLKKKKLVSFAKFCAWYSRLIEIACNTTLWCSSWSDCCWCSALSSLCVPRVGGTGRIQSEIISVSPSLSLVVPSLLIRCDPLCTV